jgi:tetratricopeptide (TPR) repeat protein
MGNAYSFLGQKEKAIECYQKVIEIKPDDDKAWNNMGNATDDLGQKEKAIEYYQKAIEIKPDYEAAWNNMGNRLLRPRPTGKSHRVLPKGHRNQAGLCTKPGTIWAVCMTTSAKRKKPSSVTKRPLRSSRTMHEAWYNMGSVYDDLGQKEKAIECYQKAIEIKPDDDEHGTTWAWPTPTLANKEKAIECYQRP